MSERHPIFATLYDPTMTVQDWLGFGRHRALTVGTASGRVLEVGIGTARNLRFYNAATSIVGIEPDSAMLARARTRSADARPPVNW